ncbi:hypothetical protein HmCmsJML019_03975 [Escherichia coli]|nr:hypothetical protein BvCmsB32A_04481 [Escherichia coli]GCT12598.1 hypothetical protein HmCmsJML019_03975 [Escherichia coli]
MVTVTVPFGVSVLPHVPTFFGKAFDTALTKSPLTWVASSMPLIVQFSFTVTLLSVPEFAFTLPLISAFLAVSFPSDVRENTGGLPPLVMVGAVRRFRNTSFMNIWLPCATNIGVSFPFAGSINAIRLAATRNWLSLPSSVSSMLRPIPAT